MEFGTMYSTTVLQGILGVSYVVGEFSGGNSYGNLPLLLVKQGYIRSKTYSVWLNNGRGTGGTLLFGGVDSSKYSGNLATLPFVTTSPNQTQITEFFVNLQGVQMSNGNGNMILPPGGSISVPALLDTSTTIIQLPDAIAQAIYSVLGADLSQETPPFVDCTLASTSITVDFIFTG